jgi:hypothetical protein
MRGDPFPIGCPLYILKQMLPVHTLRSHFFKIILVLCSHLRLVLPSGLLLAGFPNNILYACWYARSHLILIIFCKDIDYEDRYIGFVTCFRDGFFLGLFSTLKMEAIFPPKRRLTFNGLQGVISQKTVLFIKLFIVQLSPTSCYWLLLRYKCILRHPDLLDREIKLHSQNAPHKRRGEV